MQNCPICLMPLMHAPRSQGAATEYACHNCGLFSVTGTAATVIVNAGFSRSERARLSFGLRRRGGGSLLTSDLVDSLLENTSLPDAASLQDNLLLYMGGELEAPGESLDLSAPALRGWLGALTSASVQWVIEEAGKADLVRGMPLKTLAGADEYQLLKATLTIKGWDRVRELLLSARDSRKAFMAMKFGDTELDQVFANRFKPAVKATGFDLTRLDEAPRAGLIDDRLRLEIRTSRFLVADLSHANNGAYWEAGFAEGLGRPVIYTCRSDVFADPARRPHFDTNHHLTVIWDPADLAPAAEQLKAVIRVTFPEDATLTD